MYPFAMCCINVIIHIQQYNNSKHKPTYEREIVAAHAAGCHNTDPGRRTSARSLLVWWVQVGAVDANSRTREDPRGPRAGQCADPVGAVGTHQLLMCGPGAPYRRLQPVCIASKGPPGGAGRAGRVELVGGGGLQPQMQSGV